MSRKTNVGKYIREELVKRFESVVKQEIQNFQKDKDQINKHLNSLNISLEKLYKELHTTKEETKNLLNESNQNWEKRKDELEKTFGDQRYFIRKQAEEVHSMLNKLTSDIDSLLSIDQFNHYIKEVKEEFKGVLDKINDTKQEIEDQNLNRFKNVKHSLDEIEKSHNKDKTDLKEKITKLDEKVDRYRTDAESILHKLKVNDKTTFVIEKNIENLYTQINRLKQKETP